MSNSSRRSSGAVLPLSGPIRSSSMMVTGMTSSPGSNFASSTSYYSSGFTDNRRTMSPPRVRFHAPPPNPSVRFAIDRSISPRRSITAAPRSQVVPRSNVKKRTCMCSPTTHPGSFRCAMHKSLGNSNQSTISYSPNRLNMRRSAMTNSLVRIGTVEGDLVKRALAALIRPSSHHLRRRGAYEPRPSRLSVMSKAVDLLWIEISRFGIRYCC